MAAPGSLLQGTARHDQCSFDPSPWRPCLVHADNLPLTSSESESRPDHSSPGLYVTPAPPPANLRYRDAQPGGSEPLRRVPLSLDSVAQQSLLDLTIF